MTTQQKSAKRAIIIGVALSIITVSLLIIAFYLTGKQANIPVGEPSVAPASNSESSSKPEPIKEPTTARIIGVGDNLIHDGIYNQARQRAGGVGYDFSYAYEEMKDVIPLADITSINQETMLASIYEPSSYPMFNSPTELGNLMVEMGFDVFNQANNHSIDKGAKGILSTLDFWKTKPDVKVTGVYQNQDDYNNIRTLTRNDITFSFIGMTELTNGLSLPKDSEIVLMRTDNEQVIKERIEKAKAISDVVVVNVHWGVEYTHTPNEMQKSLAKKMIDWGADIIFGHHPHVIQPVEYIERADGTKGIVCYSLGNFISAQEYGPRMIGGMLDVSVEKNYSTEMITITNARFIPVVTHYGPSFTNIKTYPLAKYTKELANAHGVKKRTPEFNYDYINNLVEKVIDEQFLTPYQ